MLLPAPAWRARAWMQSARQTVLLTTLVVAFFIFATGSAAATTFTVNSDSDPGTGSCDVSECTLREAINAANVDSTADIIQFSLTTLTGPPHVISPASPLPTITQPVTIDGTTHPDYFHEPAVGIDGTSAGVGATGLVLGASTTLKAIAIDNFGGAGIALTAGSSTIQGNWIGVMGSNADGGIAIGAGASNNVIGGTGPDDPNLISSNGIGIGISSSGNTIRANSITGNIGPGVSITAGNNNVIGGTTDGDGNTIQSNGGSGVLVAAGTGNAIEGNSISDNTDLGIDLGGDGITANDASPDGDTGPNNLQNFPALTTASNDTGAGTTTVTGTLDSANNTTYRIEIFASFDCTTRQGEEYVTTTNATTNGSGHATINATFDTPGGNLYSATATDPSGNTSELSACVSAPPRLTVTKAGNGTGTVTSTPAGINCGATCFADFTFNSEVTLHAVPDAGVTFVGWEGGACTGTADCVVTMDSSQEVTARFTDPAFPLHLAQAVARDPSVITGASLVAVPPNDTPNQIRTAPLSGYPTNGATYGIMTSGDATQADGPFGSASANDGGANVRGDTDFDVSILKVDLNVPLAANCLTIDFRFFSTEYPTYVGSAYNDAFIAELDTSDWDTSGSTITAPHNFAFDPSNDVISINSTGATAMTAGNAAGTGYGGGTDPLHASTVITSGAHSLYLSIFDQGDHILDSAVLLDNLTLSTRDAAACASGATSDNTAPVLTLTTPADGSSTADTTPTYSGAAGTATGDLDTITVKIYSGTGTGGTLVQTVTTTKTGGTWTVDGTTPLAPGTYTAQAQQSDSAGNTGFSTANTFTVTGTARTLTVDKNGTGSGTVTSNVGAINCGATCTDNYGDGAVVTLTATPAAGSRFAGWSDAGCPGTGTCTVTMNSDKTVTATFTKVWGLTVTKNGNGSGGVTSSPAGINCGATCSANYDQGTMVTLTATPATGSDFTGWSDAGCPGTGTCTVTMSAAKSVTATFTLQTRELTVTKSGSGTGSVSSSPGGIDCGATCSSSYDHGTSVTLTATPAAGSTFAGWSGDCSGSGTCTVDMSQARAVTATFTAVTQPPPQTHNLSVTRAGSGSGSVTSSPGGIDCGATCSASYADGTGVTLTATAAPGSTFAGWSGDCSGTGTCTVTMNGDHAVTATFTASQQPDGGAPPPDLGGPPNVGSGDLFCGVQSRGKCKGLKVKGVFDRPGNAVWTFDAFNPTPGRGGGQAAAAGKKIRLGQLKRTITKAGAVTVVFKLKKSAKTNKLYKQVKKAKLKSILVTLTFTTPGGKKTTTKTIKLKG